MSGLICPSAARATRRAEVPRGRYLGERGCHVDDAAASFVEPLRERDILSILVCLEGLPMLGARVADRAAIVDLAPRLTVTTRRVKTRVRVNRRTEAERATDVDGEAVIDLADPASLTLVLAKMSPSVNRDYPRLIPLCDRNWEDAGPIDATTDVDGEAVIDAPQRSALADERSDRALPCEGALLMIAFDASKAAARATDARS